MTCYARMTTVTVAKMILQKPSQSGPSDDPVLFPVSLFAISRLCWLLTCLNKYSKTNLLIHLVSPKQGKVRTAHHEYLLDCFREARDFEGVKIMDTQRNTSHTQLAALMMSPLEKCRDIVDRASTYRDRALQKRKLGRLDEAQCDYKDGLHCLLWYISTGDSLGLSDHSENEERIGDLFIELGFSLAFLSIHLGHLDDVLSLIEWTLGKTPEGQKEVSHTEAWYHYGLRELATGAGNGAAYCFLQTLRRQPGHLGADEAVDKMEAQLRDCTGLTERIILHNIQHVLQDFRHQTHGSAVMSTDRYGAFFQQWYAGRKEINSIGYRHSTLGSVSLEKGNETLDKEFGLLPRLA